MTNDMALALTAAAVLFLRGRIPARRVGRGVIVTNFSPAEREAYLTELAALGWPRQEVLRVIQIESGWRTDARNPNSTASGPIQILAPGLAALGFHPELPPGTRADAFARLGAFEQLPFVVKYFRQFRWERPGDTYLAVAAPSFLGSPDTAVVYPVGSRAWRANPSWRDGGGPVTAGSIRRVVA